MLFQARIHPETPASALSGEELEALRTAMLDVCTLAVAANADDDKCGAAPAGGCFATLLPDCPRSAVRF